MRDVINGVKQNVIGSKQERYSKGQARDKNDSFPKMNSKTLVINKTDGKNRITGTETENTPDFTLERSTIQPDENTDRFDIQNSAKISELAPLVI